MKNMDFLEQLLDGQKVEWKKLGEVCEIKNGQTINKRMIANHPGIYPVINSGKEPLGYTSLWNTENEPIGITTRGAGVGSVLWQEGRYYRGNLNYSVVIKDKSLCHVRYLYYYLTEAQSDIRSLCTFAGIPALNASQLKKLSIPLPSLSVQSRIVEILDKFTSLEAELEAELELRTKQYQHYREQLLDFSEENKGFKVEWKKLGEVAQYSKTRIDASLLNENNYVGVDNMLQNCKGKTFSEHVPTTGRFTAYAPKNVLIGNIRPYLKKIWFADNEGGTNGDVLVIQATDERLLPKYLYQVLSDDAFFSYDMQHAKGAKMPRGNKDKILDYIIPLPPLSVQSRIVEILDKFDALTNSITEGLPLEIKLRKQQYEYYREQLLNFPHH